MISFTEASVCTYDDGMIVQGIGWVEMCEVYDQYYGQFSLLATPLYLV